MAPNTPAWASVTSSVTGERYPSLLEVPDDVHSKP
jgi:hypothetical protein